MFHLLSIINIRPEPEDVVERTLADEEPDEEPPEVVMAWNMSNYLPEEGNIRANFSRSALTSCFLNDSN